MGHSLLIIFLFLITIYNHAQTTWFVNQVSGNDLNDGLSSITPKQSIQNLCNNNALVQAGDTVVMMGIFSNVSYNSNFSFDGDITNPHIWTQENSIKLNNVNGSENAYITFRSYDNSTILKGDGSNILRVQNSSFLRFENLHIEGQVDAIPISTALALQFLYKENGSNTVLYRVPPGSTESEIESMVLPVLSDLVERPSYTDTRGFYLSSVHHIDIINNHIHHMPGGGLRVAEGEYVNIKGNDIHDCSRRSYSGTHGLVVTKSQSSNTQNDYKISIEQNKVHHNYNEIFSWAPTKTYITPHIDEGKGISLQRNEVTTGWINGRILVANNLCYWNGYSGLHSNDGSRIDFIHNTCYMNSYTGTITNAGNGTGNNIGISFQGGDDFIIANNISVIDGSFGGYAISVDTVQNLIVSNNISFSSTGNLSIDPDLLGVELNGILADPQFINSTEFDFHLSTISTAIDAANENYQVNIDFDDVIRTQPTEIGAFEYLSETNAISQKNLDQLIALPNPFIDVLSIKTNGGQVTIQDYNGKKVYESKIPKGKSCINLQHLEKGIYVLTLIQGNTIQTIKIIKSI